MTESLLISRMSRRRRWLNQTTRWVVGLGGAGVIGAITLIFGYLLWVVAPIFSPGGIESSPDIAVVEREPVLVDVSENGDVFLRLSRQGILEFYDAHSGVPISAFNLNTEVVHAQRVYPLVDVYAILDIHQQLTFIRAQYIVSFIDDERKLTAQLDYPFTGKPIEIGPTSGFDVHLNDNELLVATSDTRTITLYRFTGVEMGYSLPSPQRQSIVTDQAAHQLYLGARNEWIYALSDQGDVELFDIKAWSQPRKLFSANLLSSGAQLTASDIILGRYSLLIADSLGQVVQWSLIRDTTGTRLEPLRTFEFDTYVHRFVMEPRRKGFAALEHNGNLTLLYPTSQRKIASLRTSILAASSSMAVSPRSNQLIVANDPQSIKIFDLDNKHPELSLGSLWAQVWYEGYPEPRYSWQSSSADNDFEPKFSLIPLAFGTFKAAFYALLFAIPVAIMGAIYTAYFMSQKMRSWVKPGIEMMAALPTVILGFIGGLWLAPIVEANLSSVLAIFFVLPALLVLFALSWSRLPERATKPLAGWYGLIVTPIIVLGVYMAFDIGPLLEQYFFGGDSRTWFREVLGLNYDQRNALVVGIIMGLAVVPTIFSIAEDAIYGVPTHLTNGSLALGATRWQTLMRVVLLTASPGIFSAVMIGMGRAVGETMIVLMATGNTPLMDFNIFEGMRTFAANIAVELPEAEVNSSHYRILFLTALVLFILTFLFNTFAELVRQRLRSRYGSL